ncbi:MAG TPA: winged helix-turn-helix domain-containing protein, partial [Amaricoccus sp.]|nr:winged helix-turn-helix domain-containing protein [Amaricoccus sp.]
MEPVAFGPFVLDATRGTLTRGGAPVPLGQKALAVLAALAEAPGRTIPKEDLLARGWPGAIVEEGNLTVQVAALRKALGEDWILTVPRVGYRLLAPRAEPAPPVAAIPRLAVLPFADLGADPERGWFADGVVADIVAALGRFRSFSVVALNSSLAYRGRVADVREVAAELGVRYLLEGTVRRAGERLRITAELVDGESGGQLWSESLDGALAEVFDFQDRITAAVATVAEPRIHAAEIARSRRERPRSVATYDLYLRALAAILAETEAGNAEAYALALEGLGREPDDPHLLTLASWVLEHRTAMGWPPFGADDRARCGAFARAALARAGDDATLLSRCGVSLLQGAGEYDWGMALLRAAVEANPNNVMVLVQAGVGHLHCGDLDEAVALARRADLLRAGDLGAHFPLCVMAHVAVLRGRYADALDLAGRALARNPNFDPTLWMLIAASAHLGRLAEARHYLGMLQALTPGITVGRIRAGQPARDP